MAVIINSCNRPFLLKDLVEQLKLQLKGNDSIIIVNDGDEGSVNLRSENVYVVEHCKDYYAVASGRNKGVEAAIDLGYEWGLFLDDDIILKDGCLDQHKENWDSKETLYAGKIISDESNGKDVRRVLEKYIDTNEIMFESGKIEDLALRLGGGANISVHLPTLLAYGGFDEKCDGNWGYEDTELYHRLQKQGWDIEYLKEAIIDHRHAPKGASYYERGDQTNRSEIEGF